MTEFDKYKKLIQERAWYYSKKWGVDYDEMEAEGFYIYVKTLNSYDPSKGKFSVYLYFNLRELNNFGKDEFRKSGKHLTKQDKIELNEKKCSYEINIEEFLKVSRDSLSDVAYRLLEWILSFKWADKRSKPTITSSARYFKISRFCMVRYWEELKRWWNDKGQELLDSLKIENF